MDLTGIDTALTIHRLYFLNFDPANRIFLVVFVTINVAANFFTAGLDSGRKLSPQFFRFELLRFKHKIVVVVALLLSGCFIVILLFSMDFTICIRLFMIRSSPVSFGTDLTTVAAPQPTVAVEVAAAVLTTVSPPPPSKATEE